MKKTYSLTFLILLIITLSSCGTKTPPMPENKILKEEYNLENNSQDFSIYMKSLDTTTASTLVTAYVDKYKEKNLAMLKFKIYDTELPLDLINKINAPVTTDSAGNAIMTFPPKGTKSIECWYWYKNGNREMTNLKEQK
jgi:hypothetical protein